MFTDISVKLTSNKKEEPRATFNPKNFFEKPSPGIATFKFKRTLLGTLILVLLGTKTSAPILASNLADTLSLISFLLLNEKSVLRPKPAYAPYPY